jgi:hypothetical protein
MKALLFFMKVFARELFKTVKLIIIKELALNVNLVITSVELVNNLNLVVKDLDATMLIEDVFHVEQPFIYNSSAQLC